MRALVLVAGWIVVAVIALLLLRTTTSGTPEPEAVPASRETSYVRTVSLHGPAAVNVTASEGTSADVLTTSMPVRGTASWYCGNGSACTRGYGPGDLVAAIDRKDSPYRKGDRVLVRHGDRSVVVEIVDVCGCPGRRVIDLSSAAFKRLAPLSRGVIAVTLEPVPELPETDMEGS